MAAWWAATTEHAVPPTWLTVQHFHGWGICAVVIVSKQVEYRSQQQARGMQQSMGPERRLAVSMSMSTSMSVCIGVSGGPANVILCFADSAAKRLPRDPGEGPSSRWVRVCVELAKVAGL